MTVFNQHFSSELSFKEHTSQAPSQERSSQDSLPEHFSRASSQEHFSQDSFPEHLSQAYSEEHFSQYSLPEHFSRASSQEHLSQQGGQDDAVDTGAGAGAVKTAEHLTATHGSSLTKTLRGALKTGLSAAAIMTAVASFNTAHAAIPVMDASALNESVMQRIISIEQWARDNINQARQIQELLSGNNIAHDTQNLMDRNYVMDSKESWQNIARIKEQSLSMLYASRSAWEEFGSAQQYLASFQKASAWSKCMQAGNCSFSRVLTELEDSTISQAMEAFEMSQSMNIKLQEQIDQVQALVVESQSTASQAGTLDALSKINGSAALSMIDLNNQIALLTRLQSHDLARQSNVRLAQEGYLKEITRHVERAPDRLPLQSFMQRH